MIAAGYGDTVGDAFHVGPGVKTTLDEYEKDLVKRPGRKRTTGGGGVPQGETSNARAL
jgi:hypothetical protein